jgi:hypothetical protein
MKNKFADQLIAGLYATLWLQEILSSTAAQTGTRIKEKLMAQYRRVIKLLSQTKWLISLVSLSGHCNSR